MAPGEGTPRILFVLGKGGVGRSTVATTLGLAAADRGERVLVFEWTLADPIAPWFGLPPAGTSPVEVAPGLSVMSYSLDEALRAYFVDHLRLRRFHRRVIDAAPVRALVDAAPGIAELLFLGTLWWLTTLARDEAGLDYDRIVVDAPATGHGASILDMPGTLAPLGASALLGKEIERVVTMMRDATWTGAIVVSTPEDLAVEETMELVPRVSRALDRPPLAVLVNRAVRHLAGDGDASRELDAGLSPPARAALEVLSSELRARARTEARLGDLLAVATTRGVFAFEDVMLASGRTKPRDVVEALRPRAAALW